MFEFFNEIKKFKKIYCLISGGYHSTSAVYLLYDFGFKNITLIHNKTWLEMDHVNELIQKLIFETNYSYIETTPYTEIQALNILKTSLKEIPKIVESFKNNQLNYRDWIPCCKKLKKSPSRKLYTKEINKKNSVIISALCPFESRNRNYWLKQLRNQKTYLRVHKKFGNVNYAYPFRDIYTDRPFHKYLINKDIIPEHSGCKICPIKIAYNKFNNNKTIKKR